MSEDAFAFLDAIIAGDIETALKIAYQYEQGEQIGFDLGGTDG